MEHDKAAQAFSTLGHPGRLAVMRLLMRFAPQGVRPTEIAKALGLRQNTLSHHLADLTAAGLVNVARRGRSLFYAVDLDTAERLIGYLALDVGRGRADLLGVLRPDQRASAAMTIRDHDRSFDVLFICSGNSARSIFAEALLRDLGPGRFRAFSAGTQPNSTLNPRALDILMQNGHDPSGLRSKHISEFRKPGCGRMDFVLTVCDQAATEDCPAWPGLPVLGHWGLPDPVLATGTDTERTQVFARTYAAMRHKIVTFVGLPFESLSRMALQSHVDAIGAEQHAKA
ncbi:MAG: metalloregulator ArsR/SmtB family transcription factor [Roseinatronobacter sp.]